MRLLISIVLVAFLITANCAELKEPESALCVAKVDALLDERAEKIPTLVANIREQFGDDADTLEARAAYMNLMTEIEAMENRIRVEIARCPEAAQREVERRREVPLQVQIDD